jgi:omptin
MSGIRFVLFAAGFIASVTPAAAADMQLQSVDGAVTFSGSYGITALRANEFVYEGKAKVSQLIWKSDWVQTVTGDIAIDLEKDFYVKIKATAGFAGDGFMTDYDWFYTGRPWSHRSQHPDTRLNHYFTGDIELGRTVAEHGGTEIGLGAGISYTDVKWAAYGGSYIFSDTGWRADRGDIPDGEKVIFYRQQWPAPFLAANLSHVEGRWSLNGSLKAGLAFDAKGTDDHWMRDLRFVDHYYTTPTVGLDASIGYALRDNIQFYASGSFDHMARVRADSRMIDTITGDKSWFRDGAGGDFTSATISFGLKGRF